MPPAPADIQSFTASTLRIAWYSTISYVVSYSSQLVDMFWVAKLSVGVPTAIAIVSTIFVTVLTLNEVVGVGSVAVISQAKGVGNNARTASVVLQTLLMKFLMGALMACGFVLFLRFGLHWYGLDPVIEGYVRDYGFVIWPSLILVPVSASVLTALRILNEAKSTAWISIAALSMNAMLTPLLIFGYGSVPALGVSGAAWATIIVDAIVLFIGLRRLLFNRAGIRFSWRAAQFEAAVYRHLLFIGMPVAGMVFLMNAEQLIITAIVAQQAVSISDGFGIGQRLFGVLYISTMGMGIGMAVTAGEAIGAGRYDLLKRAVWPVLARLMLAMAAVCSVVAVFAPLILAVFTTDPVAIDTGVVYLRFMAVAMLFYCAQSVFHGVFTGAGRNMPMLLAAMVTYLCIEFPLLWWLSQAFAGQLPLLWLVVLVSTLLLALALGWLFLQNHWRAISR